MNLFLIFLQNKNWSTIQYPTVNLVEPIWELACKFFQGTKSFWSVKICPNFYDQRQNNSWINKIAKSLCPQLVFVPSRAYLEDQIGQNFASALNVRTNCELDPTWTDHTRLKSWSLPIEIVCQLKFSLKGYVGMERNPKLNLS